MNLDTGYPDRVRPGKYWDTIPIKATTASFDIPSNSLFTNHPTCVATYSIFKEPQMSISTASFRNLWQRNTYCGNKACPYNLCPSGNIIRATCIARGTAEKWIKKYGANEWIEQGQDRVKWRILWTRKQHFGLHNRQKIQLTSSHLLKDTAPWSQMIKDITLWIQSVDKGQCSMESVDKGYCSMDSFSW
jgi:hypothetical protein